MEIKCSISSNSRRLSVTVFEVDLNSFDLILAFSLSRPPFQSRTQVGLASKIRQGRINPLPQHVREERENGENWANFFTLHLVLSRFKSHDQSHAQRFGTKRKTMMVGNRNKTKLIHYFK